MSKKITFSFFGKVTVAALIKDELIRTGEKGFSALERIPNELMKSERLWRGKQKFCPFSVLFGLFLEEMS